MKFTLEQTRNTILVQSYGTGYFQVSGIKHTQPLILTPQRMINTWCPSATLLASWTHADLEILLTLPCEVLIIGCGTRWQLPPAALLEAFHPRGIGVEVMDSGAACRTYNLLASEGRQVAAALLLP